jgi:hypothetical protein
MATITEQALINQLATEFESIDGITTTFGFAQNPGVLSNTQLPAVVFVPIQTESAPLEFHNAHSNDIKIAGVLFVSPRENKLKFLDNDAMPFLFKVRNHFQQSAVISRLLDTGLTQAMLVDGRYSAGGILLTYGIEYIGLIFHWEFKERGKKNPWIVEWSQIGGDDTIS